MNPPQINNSEINHPIKVKYIYDEKRKDMFEKHMANDPSLLKLNYSLSQNMDFTENTIDETISNLNTIITTAARKSFFVKKVINNQNKKNDNRKDWYTRSCKGYRNKFRLCSKKLSKDPYNKALLNKFLQARSEYKKECRKAEKCHRQSLTKKLLGLENNDPKLFWNIIKKMNDWGKPKQDPSDNISPKQWKKHFEELLNDRELGRENISENGMKTFEPLLDGHISTN